MATPSFHRPLLASFSCPLLGLWGLSGASGGRLQGIISFTLIATYFLCFSLDALLLSSVLKSSSQTSARLQQIFFSLRFPFPREVRFTGYAVIPPTPLGPSSSYF